LLSILQLLANLVQVGHCGEFVQSNSTILRVVLVFAALETSKQGGCLVVLFGLGLAVRLVNGNSLLLVDRSLLRSSLGSNFGLGLGDFG
jgi:hypothetical protein